jgi:hypothetical protein
VNRADRRQLNVTVKPPDLLADLRRTPAWMLLLQLHDQRLDLKRQLIGVPMRPTRSIIESIDTAVLVALEELVAGLARDIELAA